MPVSRPAYQLPLSLDLPEPEEKNISSEDARIKAEAARKTLEGMFGKIGSPKWLEEYGELMRGGWPWRVAAYIAWASSPRIGREPRTQDELARFHLGLTSDRVIATWRSYAGQTRRGTWIMAGTLKKITHRDIKSER